MLNQKFAIIKRLIFLLSLLVGVYARVNVIAQTNTGTAPYTGTSHDYTLETSVDASTYYWWVTDSSGSTITIASGIATFAKVDPNDEDFATTNDVASGAGFYRIEKLYWVQVQRETLIMYM